MKNKFGWHVIYTRFRHENKVQTDLKRFGVESFVPMTTTVKNWSDRKKKVSSPLFPSYVFVNIQSNEDFHRAMSLDSAASFVKFGRDYGRLSDEEVDMIKMIVGYDELTEVKANVQLPTVGDKITIEYGELAGLECEVYRVDNDSHISVWIDALNQNISAKLPAHYFHQTMAMPTGERAFALNL